MSHARDVVEVIARALADEPDEVKIVETAQRGMTLLELSVSPADLGRIIGRQGRTAAALRTLVAATAERDGDKVTLEIRETLPA
ncbi:MAG: KH domain-containing protein [Bacteroidales bacterium]